MCIQLWFRTSSPPQLLHMHWHTAPRIEHCNPKRMCSPFSVQAPPIKMLHLSLNISNFAQTRAEGALAVACCISHLERIQNPAINDNPINLMPLEVPNGNWTCKEHDYLVVKHCSLGNHSRYIATVLFEGMTDTAWLSASLFFRCSTWHVAQIDSMPQMPSQTKLCWEIVVQFEFTRPMQT